MAIRISAFFKGLSHRLRKKREAARFAAISWTKEKILKHQDDKTIKQMKFGKLLIEYKRPYEVLHTYKELFEEEIYFFRADTDAPLIIDCGANIGLSVLYFKSLYPNATLIAYEPDAENMTFLKRNLALNNLAGVECRQKAVWISNEELLFASDGTQGSSIATAGQASNTISVKAERLADVIRNTKIDFLKIDIEGAESDVLHDCAPFLQNVQYLFVEYHGKANETGKLADLFFLLKQRYQVYIKLAADNLQHPFAEKTTAGSFDVQLNICCYPHQDRE